MIRTPTTITQQYAWHSNALLGIHGMESVTTEDPQPGWYKRRIVKLGPFVPARIWLYQDIDDRSGELLDDERLQCEVNGSYADPAEAWQWLCQNPISEAEFKRLTALKAWAEDNAPNEPILNPTRPVDWRAVPIPTF